MIVSEVKLAGEANVKVKLVWILYVCVRYTGTVPVMVAALKES